MIPIWQDQLWFRRLVNSVDWGKLCGMSSELEFVLLSSVAGVIFLPLAINWKVHMVRFRHPHAFFLPIAIYTLHLLCVSWFFRNNYNQDNLKVSNTQLLMKWPYYYSANCSTVELLDAQYFKMQAIHLGTEMKFALLQIGSCTCYWHSLALLPGQQAFEQVGVQGSVCLH